MIRPACVKFWEKKKTPVSRSPLIPFLLKTLTRNIFRGGGSFFFVYLLFLFFVFFIFFSSNKRGQLFSVNRRSSATTLPSRCSPTANLQVYQKRLHPKWRVTCTRGRKFSNMSVSGHHEPSRSFLSTSCLAPLGSLASGFYRSTSDFL